MARKARPDIFPKLKKLLDAVADIDAQSAAAECAREAATLATVAGRAYPVDDPAVAEALRRKDAALTAYRLAKASMSLLKALSKSVSTTAKTAKGAGPEQIIGGSIFSD